MEVCFSFSFLFLLIENTFCFLSGVKLKMTYYLFVPEKKCIYSSRSYLIDNPFLNVLSPNVSFVFLSLHHHGEFWIQHQAVILFRL